MSRAIAAHAWTNQAHNQSTSADQNVKGKSVSKHSSANRPSSALGGGSAALKGRNLNSNTQIRQQASKTSELLDASNASQILTANLLPQGQPSIASQLSFYKNQTAQSSD